MDKNMTLLVMAAGMGSRFGGLKQIEPVGPHGEVILEFSVYDALEAGFDKAVFVIKKAIEHDFQRNHRQADRKDDRCRICFPRA